MVNTRAADILLWGIITYGATINTSSYAEVYQWTDENGKVHFSDRKPTKVASKNISESVKQNNIENSQDSTHQLEQIFTKKTPGETEYEQKKRQEQQHQAQQWESRCREAKQRLRNLKGPVYFVDEEGNEYDISEKERQQKVKDFEAQIQQYCG